MSLETKSICYLGLSRWAAKSRKRGQSATAASQKIGHHFWQLGGITQVSQWNLPRGPWELHYNTRTCWPLLLSKSMYLQLCIMPFNNSLIMLLICTIIFRETRFTDCTAPTVKTLQGQRRCANKPRSKTASSSVSASRSWTTSCRLVPTCWSQCSASPSTSYCWRTCLSTRRTCPKSFPSFKAPSIACSWSLSASTTACTKLPSLDFGYESCNL